MSDRKRITIPSPVTVVRADHVDQFNPGGCNVLVVTSIRWMGGSDDRRMHDESQRAAESLAARYPEANVWHGSMFGIATEPPHREWETSPFAGIEAMATPVEPQGRDNA